MNYITHYYNKKGNPFMSLSELNDAEAIRIMKNLYSDKHEYGKRFADPIAYISNRRDTEKWVRSEFINNGFSPKDIYPLYFVFGESKWMEEQIPRDFEPGKICIPLADIGSNDVSFTYPDSMISKWLGEAKPNPFYDYLYHGKVFSKKEIIQIVSKSGIPEYSWKTLLPPNLAPYIEAQVWDKSIIKKYIK